MIRPKIAEIAKKILSAFLLTVGAHVLLKSMPGTYGKLCATSLALNFSIVPSELYFALNNPLETNGFAAFRKFSIFVARLSSSSLIATCL